MSRIDEETTIAQEGDLTWRFWISKSDRGALYAAMWEYEIDPKDPRFKTHKALLAGNSVERGGWAWRAEPVPCKRATAKAIAEYRAKVMPLAIEAVERRRAYLNDLGRVGVPA